MSYDLSYGPAGALSVSFSDYLRPGAVPGGVVPTSTTFRALCDSLRVSQPPSFVQPGFGREGSREGGDGNLVRRDTRRDFWGEIQKGVPVICGP